MYVLDRIAVKLEPQLELKHAGNGSTVTIATSVYSTITSNSSSKTHGAADPHTRITWASFLGSEEPSLKFGRASAHEF